MNFHRSKAANMCGVTLVLEAQVIKNQTFNRLAYTLDSFETNYSCTSLIESGGRIEHYHEEFVLF